MFWSASTRRPSAATKARWTLRTMILDVLFSIFHRLEGRAGARDGRGSRSRRGRRVAPGKQPLLEEGQQKPEQEGGDADGYDARVHALEVQDLAGRLHHVAHALPRVDHLGQDHVGPPDIVQ